MKAIILLIIFCLSALSAFAQTKEARNFDEFGELSCDDLLSRLGNLASELQNEPTATAFIIIYEGKHRFDYAESKKYNLPRFGEAVARTQTMQQRLTLNRYDLKKFIFIDGGFREHYWVEVWIVPRGAKLPKPTPTLERMKYRKGTPTDICREF